VHAEALLASGSVAAGWLGQSCFFTRFFVQWLASERARRSVVPRSFWWLSLAGAVLTSVYALRRGEALLLAGFLANGAIAARNLRLARGGAPADAARTGLLGLAALAFVAVLVAVELHLEGSPWALVGGAGQALWAARFPLQWWLSERAGVSHFPRVFWWVSLGGNLLLLAYALHLRDPVFVLGFLPGPFLQVRNLALSRRVSPA
jgi:lipid-A-disaccharide synthase-like uncharacterized protein